MAVDEDNLVVVVRSLHALLADYESKSNKIKNLITSFDKIKLVDGEIQTDIDTGAIMTQDRRDEIYDGCIAIANELLGINTE